MTWNAAVLGCVFLRRLSRIEKKITARPKHGTIMAIPAIMAMSWLSSRSRGRHGRRRWGAFGGFGFVAESPQDEDNCGIAAGHAKGECQHYSKKESGRYH